MIKKFLTLVNYNLYESKYYFAKKFVEACVTHLGSTPI